MERGNSSCSSSEEDRISSLPDSLIHHILSFMYTNDAVQTCVLSKRWRYICTSIPVLKLNDCALYCESSDEDSDDADKETERFKNFVDKVLSLRDPSDIRVFHLECSLYYEANSTLDECINRWVATAVAHNVQELSIRANPDDDFEIPLCLCTCKSLTKLKLELSTICDLADYHGKIILPSCEMSLPRLKSLHLRLEYLSFNDETLTNKFFSSFPTLESLVIVFWGLNQGEFGNMNLKISLPELKHFKFNSTEVSNCMEEESNSEVALHAPSLSSLIFDSYMSTSFVLENLSSLVTADIEININREDKMPGIYSAICEEKKEFYAQRCMRFFRGLHKVKVLKSRCSFIKALGGALHILDSQQLEFYNLRCLELRTYLSRDCLHSIFYVLKTSPNIESVSLQIFQQNYDKPPVYPFCDEVKINPENIGDYWDVGLSLPCMMCHLKYVKIEGLRGCVNELKLIEILLKHATILEKVVLTRCYSAEQDSESEKRMTKFSEMLLMFPRASKNIIILCKF